MTEAEHLGDGPSVRLLFNLVGAVCVAAGYWGLVRHEQRSRRDPP